MLRELDANKLQRKLDAVCKKYEGTDESQALEIDVLKAKVYAPSSLSKVEKQRQQQEFYEFNSSFDWATPFFHRPQENEERQEVDMDILKRKIDESRKLSENGKIKDEMDQSIMEAIERAFEIVEKNKNSPEEDPVYAKKKVSSGKPKKTVTFREVTEEDVHEYEVESDTCSVRSGFVLGAPLLTIKLEDLPAMCSDSEEDSEGTLKDEEDKENEEDGEKTLIEGEQEENGRKKDDVIEEKEENGDEMLIQIKKECIFYHYGFLWSRRSRHTRTLSKFGERFLYILKQLYSVVQVSNPDWILPPRHSLENGKNIVPPQQIFIAEPEVKPLLLKIKEEPQDVDEFDGNEAKEAPKQGKAKNRNQKRKRSPSPDLYPFLPKKSRSDDCQVSPTKSIADDLLEEISLPAGRFWSATASEVVKKVKEFMGGLEVVEVTAKTNFTFGIDEKCVLEFCATEKEAPLIDLWAQHAAKDTENYIGKIDYVQMEESRFERQARRRNERMQFTYHTYS